MLEQKQLDLIKLVFEDYVENLDRSMSKPLNKVLDRLMYLSEENNSFILVYSLKNEFYGSIDDYWLTFDNLKDAKKRYQELLNLDDLYSASITTVLESTDY